MKINKTFPSDFQVLESETNFAEINSQEELIEVLKQWSEISRDFSDSGKRVLVLGGGTNILIDDKGFDGLVIQNKIRNIESMKTLQKSTFKVGAGVLISDLLDYCIENSLSGLEWAGGLPGTVGGAVRGNAGAFGGEIKDVIEQVESVEYELTYEVTESPTSQVGRIKKRTKGECKFGYRESIFKSEKENEVILGVELRLTLGNKEEIERIINEN